MIEVSAMEKPWNFDATELGTRRRFVLRLDAHENGSVIEVPVHVLVGNRCRPRLAVVGGVHGDEYDGIRAAQRLAKEEDLANLDGTLVVIPVANPSAFAAGQRLTPIDGIDLNRVFPGKPDGSVSERLAYLLVDSVLRHMDFVFTLHGARTAFRLAWYLEFLDCPNGVGRASHDAAMAAGFKDLVAFPAKPGFLLPALAEFGVPVIEGEVGGQGEVRDENAAFYVARVQAVMQHLSLKAGKAENSARPLVWRTKDVVAPVSGLLLREVGLRDEVRDGQRVGRIIDREGSQLTDLYAPIAGVVGGYRAHAAIRIGDTAVRIWTPAKD